MIYNKASVIHLLALLVSTLIFMGRWEYNWQQLFSRFFFFFQKESERTKYLMLTGTNSCCAGMQLDHICTQTSKYACWHLRLASSCVFYTNLYTLHMEKANAPEGQNRNRVTHSLPTGQSQVWYAPFRLPTRAAFFPLCRESSQMFTPSHCHSCPHHSSCTAINQFLWKASVS